MPRRKITTLPAAHTLDANDRAFLADVDSTLNITLARIRAFVQSTDPAANATTAADPTPDTPETPAKPYRPFIPHGRELLHAAKALRTVFDLWADLKNTRTDPTDDPRPTPAPSAKKPASRATTSAAGGTDPYFNPPDPDALPFDESLCDEENHPAFVELAQRLQAILDNPKMLSPDDDLDDDYPTDAAPDQHDPDPRSTPSANAPDCAAPDPLTSS